MTSSPISDDGGGDGDDHSDTDANLVIFLSESDSDEVIPTSLSAGDRKKSFRLKSRKPQDQSDSKEAPGRICTGVGRHCQERKGDEQFKSPTSTQCKDCAKVVRRLKNDKNKQNGKDKKRPKDRIAAKVK